jgi:hypothetical protein
MTASHERERAPSLLTRQLRALGYEASGAPLDAASAAEAARMSSLHLPALELPERAGRRTSRAWRHALAMAAMLALVAASVPLLRYLKTSPDDGIRARGASRATLYWERAGVVAPWTPGTALTSGDRVRVELLAGERLIAFLGIFDGQHRAMLAPAAVAAGGMILEVGEQAAFPGALQLDEVNEHEQLVLWLCHLAPGESGGDERDAVQAGSLPKGCEERVFGLR